MRTVFEGKERCCGCGACSNSCPVQAIEMKADEEGFLYPMIDEAKCVDCGACRRVCPFAEGSQKNGGTPAFYIAKHRRAEVLMNSASGGAFTALSDAVMAEGGVVYGADFDEEFRVCHVRAKQPWQRDRMRISKYAQSDLGQVFRQVREDLRRGTPVLFTGTPCQNAGLKAFLTGGKSNGRAADGKDRSCIGDQNDEVSDTVGKGRSKVCESEGAEGEAGKTESGGGCETGKTGSNKGCEAGKTEGGSKTIECEPNGKQKLLANLYLCDLICHSAPSPLVWKDFKELLEREYGGTLAQVWFRTKELPWNRVNSKETFTFRLAGSDETYVDNRFYDLFFGKMNIMRPSCEECPFADVRRVGDVTIADYWDVEKYAPEWNDPRGVSLILVSTEKGRRLLEQCRDSLEYEERPPEEELAEQPRLRGPVRYPAERGRFWERYWSGGVEAVLWGIEDGKMK